MRWNAMFAEPFALADGRRVDTLADARTLMLHLPPRQQRSAHWQQAQQLVEKAANRGDKNAVLEARAQLQRALKAEGLIS